MKRNTPVKNNTSHILCLMNEPITNNGAIILMNNPIFMSTNKRIKYPKSRSELPMYL